MTPTSSANSREGRRKKGKYTSTNHHRRSSPTGKLQHQQQHHHKLEARDNQTAQVINNRMMNDLLQRRLSELTGGQGGHNHGSLSEIAALHHRTNHTNDAVASAIQANNLALAMELNAIGNDSTSVLQQQQQNRMNSSLSRADQTLLQEHTRRNSSLGLSGLLGLTNDDSYNTNSTLASSMVGRGDAIITPPRRNLAADRRTSLDVLGEAAAAADLRQRIEQQRRDSLGSTTNSMDQSSHSLLNSLSNVDSQILRMEAEIARRQASLQLALQGRNNPELVQRRNSLDLLQRQQRNQLELAMQQKQRLELALQRRNSLELAQRRNSIEQARRNSLEQARRNSLELARRSSLELAQRRHSIELAQRRNSLEMAQRRSSLEQAQRRNSADLVNSRTNGALRNNSFSQRIAEQFLADRRHTLSLGRNASLGLNPIDPRHVESIFDDGTPSGLSGLGLPQTEADVLLESIKRQSLMHSLNLANNSLSPQGQAMNSQTSQALSGGASLSEETTPEVFQQQHQVSSILNAVESLQQKMQKSQQSQKSIQSWDKKMGLKRSHSSTMTKTHRSRKQLKDLFEKQKKMLERRMGSSSNFSQRNSESIDLM